MTQLKSLVDVFAVCKSHGELSEPDHEIGDLQQVIEYLVVRMPSLYLSRDQLLEEIQGVLLECAGEESFEVLDNKEE